MAEDILPFFDREIKDQMQGIIKVVGVGGGGCNAVRNMYLDKVYTKIWKINRIWYERLKVITLPRELVI